MRKGHVVFSTCAPCVDVPAPYADVHAPPRGQPQPWTP
jgi:hypothetical protein